MEVACPICNKHQMVVLIKDVEENEKTYNIFFCEMCNVGVTIPIPSPGELSSLYSSGKYRAANGKRFVGLVETAINFSRQLRRKRIENYKEKGRILDIGCGRGVFLDVMRK